VEPGIWLSGRTTFYGGKSVYFTVDFAPGGCSFQYVRLWLGKNDARCDHLTASEYGIEVLSADGAWQLQAEVSNSSTVLERVDVVALPNTVNATRARVHFRNHRDCTFTWVPYPHYLMRLLQFFEADPTQVQAPEPVVTEGPTAAPSARMPVEEGGAKTSGVSQFRRWLRDKIGYNKFFDPSIPTLRECSPHATPPAAPTPPAVLTAPPSPPPDRVTTFPPTAVPAVEAIAPASWTTNKTSSIACSRYYNTGGTTFSSANDLTLYNDHCSRVDAKADLGSFVGGYIQVVYEKRFRCDRYYNEIPVMQVIVDGAVVQAFHLAQNRNQWVTQNVSITLPSHQASFVQLRWLITVYDCLYSAYQVLVGGQTALPGNTDCGSQCSGLWCAYGDHGQNWLDVNITEITRRSQLLSNQPPPP